MNIGIGYICRHLKAVKKYTSLKPIARSFWVKFVAWIFLAVILFYSGGYFLSFRLIQNHIRKEVKARIRRGIDESDLTTIDLTLSNIKDIEWVKSGREFVYHHEMYDVVHVRITANHVVLSCLNDKTEHRLILHYMQHSRAAKVLQKLNNIFYYHKPQQPVCAIECTFRISEIQKTFNILSINLSIPAPPPKVI